MVCALKNLCTKSVKCKNSWLKKCYRFGSCSMRWKTDTLQYSLNMLIRPFLRTFVRFSPLSPSLAINRRIFSFFFVFKMFYDISTAKNNNCLLTMSCEKKKCTYVFSYLWNYEQFWTNNNNENAQKAKERNGNNATPKKSTVLPNVVLTSCPITSACHHRAEHRNGMTWHPRRNRQKDHEGKTAWNNVFNAHFSHIGQCVNGGVHSVSTI